MYVELQKVQFGCPRPKCYCCQHVIKKYIFFLRGAKVRVLQNDGGIFWARQKKRMYEKYNLAPRPKCYSCQHVIKSTFFVCAERKLQFCRITEVYFGLGRKKRMYVELRKVQFGCPWPKCYSCHYVMKKYIFCLRRAKVRVLQNDGGIFRTRQ